jgi:lipopolysaccharide transport system ATP-binding protein
MPWCNQGAGLREETASTAGHHWAGKSTLLKILSRVTTQSSGQIKVKGRIASLLEVGTGFHPELTGR